MPFLRQRDFNGIRVAFCAASLGLACLTYSKHVDAAPPSVPRRLVPNVRQLNLDDELPIPTPNRIVMNESFLKGDAISDERNENSDKRETQNSAEGDSKSHVDVTSESVSKAPEDEYMVREREYNWLKNTREEIVFPLAEIFSLRSVEQVGKTKQIVANRDGFITVLGASPKDGTLPQPADSVRIVGRKLGVVLLTVIGEKGVKTYSLKITPSVAQLETLIARQFPLSSVEVTAAGDHMLVVEGTVETPGDVEGILTLLQNFVGRQGKVINGIKVAGVSQVQLEVVIARVDRTEARRLGVNFEYAGQGGFGGTQVGNSGGVTPLVSNSNVSPPVPGGNAFTNIGGAATSAITPASTVFVGVTQGLQQFMAQLEFLKRNGVVKVLARPTLVTLSGRPAEFLVGGEQPFPYQVSAIAQPSVDFKKFGTRLNFLPVILGPDKIRLDLVPEFSTVDPDSSTAASVGGTSIPRFITQRIHTVVEMEPGQTLVLGGLLQTEIASQVDRIPFLGDLPYAGVAFRKVSYVERELELLVIVTPRFVSPLDGSEGPVSLPGDETRSPTDKELFFHGLPEAPHCPDQGGTGHPELSRGQSQPPRVLMSKSGKTSVHPVAVQSQVKDATPSKFWPRLPGATRRTEERSASRPDPTPSVIVQRTAISKTAKPTVRR